jgi:hypothetical protein
MIPSALSSAVPTVAPSVERTPLPVEDCTYYCMFYPESATQPILAQSVVAAVSMSTYFRLKFAVRGMAPPQSGTVCNIVDIGPETGTRLLTVMMTSASRITIAYNGYYVVTDADLLYPAGMNTWTTIVMNIGVSGIYVFSSYDPDWRNGGSVQIVDTTGSSYLLTASNRFQPSAGGYVRDIAILRKGSLF